ncbi:MAG: metal ABC transporter permease [Thermodesulfobacteriota bacterium]
MPDLAPIYGLLRSILPLESLEPRFMQQAFLGLILLAPMTAAMGVQVVNFRLAFFSDAISHSTFTGVALGLLLGADGRLTMILFGLVVGLGIMAAGRRTSLSTDTVIGVFFSAAVAFGLAVVSRDQRVAREMMGFIYGDILTISEAEILWLAALFAALAVFQAWGYNRLLYVGLNPVLATAHEVKVRAYQYLFAGFLSLIVIFSVWTVGLLLVTALLVVPAAGARNLAHTAGGMFWWALAIGSSSAVAGLLISAQPWARTATGATIVLCASAWFLASALVPLVRDRIRA